GAGPEDPAGGTGARCRGIFRPIAAEYPSGGTAAAVIPLYGASAVGGRPVDSAAGSPAGGWPRAGDILAITAVVIAVPSVIVGRIPAGIIRRVPAGMPGAKSGIIPGRTPGQAQGEGGIIPAVGVVAIP